MNECDWIVMGSRGEPRVQVRASTEREAFDRARAVRSDVTFVSATPGRMRAAFEVTPTRPVGDGCSVFTFGFNSSAPAPAPSPKRRR